MKRYLSKCLFIFLTLTVWGMTAVTTCRAADETNPVKVEIQTGKYAAVKGDVDKFRAIKWMKDGYSGGISSMSFEQEMKGGGVISFEGRSIPVENDNYADLTYLKGEKG